MIGVYFLVILLVGSSLSQSTCPQKTYSRISEEKCDEYKGIVADITMPWPRIPGAKYCPRKTFECGPVGSSGMIVGGKPAQVGEFPHMAAVGWSLPDGSIKFKCGGSLISERFVLTAAHCFYDKEHGEPSLVRLGTRNLADGGRYSSPVELKIKRFIEHPEYNVLGNKHDIALIELDGNVKFHKMHLRPACLQQDSYNETNVTATGWGKLGTYKDTSDVLMKVVLPMNKIQVCKDKLSSKSLRGARQICAGGEHGKDTCQGDSGGPIQSAHSDAPCVYNVIGVTSFGTARCGKNGPAVYSKVNYYLDWIEEIVWPEQ